MSLRIIALPPRLGLDKITVLYCSKYYTAAPSPASH
jgi:hypothetical protein